MELSFSGLHAKQWYNLASIFGVMIVLAVVSMHTVPIGILSRDTHALTTQTTRSPFSYAEFTGQLPSQAQLHGKQDGLSGPITIWENAFPRSGVTSIHVFIENASKAVTWGPFFMISACEICDEARSFHNCQEEMHAVLQCDYSKVANNCWWGKNWDAPRIYPSPTPSCCPDVPYSPAAATMRCSEAHVRIFSTLLEQNLDVVIPNLKSIPAARVVNLVRDPRGMYQSLKDFVDNYPPYTWYGWEPEKMDKGFAGQEWFRLNMLFGFFKHNPHHFRRICGQLAIMKNVSHPRMLHVRYEDLISTKDVRKSIISFFGFPWSTDVEHISKIIYPGLDPGSTWAHINHYPGNPGFPWSKQELATLYDVTCKLAIASWAYPLPLAK